jgi:hypothetical protein
MSARIAPEPISTSISTTTDYRSRTSTADVALPANTNTPKEPAKEETAGSRFSDVLPPLPAPPDPPGTAFAAAVAAGALSPRPQSPQEIFLRVGGTWSPPESELHLTDVTA